MFLATKALAASYFLTRSEACLAAVAGSNISICLAVTDSISSSMSFFIMPDRASILVLISNPAPPSRCKAATNSGLESISFMLDLNPLILSNVSVPSPASLNILDA